MTQQMITFITHKFKQLKNLKSPTLKLIRKSILPKTNLIKVDTKTKRKYQKKLSNLISLLVERWKLLSIILFLFVSVYYGLGALVSSKINNSLDTKLTPTASVPQYVPTSLIHILKTQIDDTAWTPALPAIFPASILDNLPNFQIGTKEAVRYLTKRLSIFHSDKSLKNAAELLNYPANIWLFSQINKDEIAPGSAKQYRKAIADITEYASKEKTSPTQQTDECVYLLESLNILLKKQIQKLEQHVQEHSSETLDLRADDIFYYTQGIAYSSYYMLQAISKDFQELIIKTNEYEDITSALKFLKKAVTLSPIAIKNASPEDIYTANHLLYLAFYLSQAQNQINKVKFNIIQKRTSLNDN